MGPATSPGAKAAPSSPTRPPRGSPPRSTSSGRRRTRRRPGQLNLGKNERTRPRRPRRPRRKPPRLYRLAADQGSAEAQYRLGHLHEYGDGVEPYFDTAMEWYAKAAAQGDKNARIKVELRDQYVRGLDLAKQGHQHAQYQVGRMYEYGMGVPKDEQEAARWYRLAAEQADLKSQERIGQLLEEGTGVPQDPEEAARFYQKMAEQLRFKADLENAQAQFELGRLYERGRGVDESIETALHWYLLSAKKGNPQAQYRLGRLYMEGKLVGQDAASAAKWFRQSVRLNALPDDAPRI
jgi:TPR repeat protein